MLFAAKRARRLAQNGAVVGLLALVAACAPGEPLEPSAPLAPPPPTTVPRVDTVTAVWPRLATADIDVALQFSAYDKTPTDSVVAEADWTATGGTVSATGSFRSSTDGEFFVVATSRRTRKRDSARVTVTRSTSTTITRVALLPDSVTLAPGQAQSFSATGLLASGASGAATFVWSSNGGNVSATGAYTAGSTVGRFRVIATLSGGALADTSIVTIAAPVPTVTLSAVEVSPSSASLLTGATQQFAALGRMSDGSSQPVVVTWSASGGSVTSGGLFTAPGTAGSVRVIGVEAGGRADTATVTVTAPAPTLTSLVLTPASASVATGGTRAFSAAATWSDGSSATPPLSWSATGGTITTSGAYTAGSTPGTFRVIVQQTGGTVADTAVVTIAAPTLTTLVLNPASVSLASGGTQQFSIGASWSDGSSTVPPVTYAATGGTISGAGLYTAGSTAGTFRVIATHTGGTRADSSTVTITPTVTAVEVTPSTATVAGGATQQFSALARLSSGGTQAVSVAWSATGGTVTTSGLYTAGTTAGTFRVVAVEQGGTRADTSVVTVTAAAAPPPSGVADPTTLPAASSQAPNLSAYQAFGMATRPAGFSYADPVSGARVWKATSASVPNANGGAGHDYSDGGNEASLGWGSNNNTHTILVRTGSGYFLVDFTRGVGFANYRELTGALRPGSDLHFSFSNNPATPRIAYVSSGNLLRRINTATMQEENIGGFPRSGVGGGWWLHHDRNDVWFIGMTDAQGTTVWAWNSQTNQFLSRTGLSYLNEPRLERDGRWVALAGEGAAYWDLQNDQVSPFTPRACASGNYGCWFAHNASLRGFFATGDPDRGSSFGGIVKRHMPSASGGSIVDLYQPADGISGIHHSGNWVQSDAELGGNLLRQWGLVSNYEMSIGWQGAPRWNRAIGFYRADGTDTRLLAHHYSSANPEYFALPLAKSSPDGKIVMFNSNMLGSGRYDLFVAEVPLR